VFPGVTIGAEQRPVTASLSPTTVAGSDASGGRRGRLPAGAWSVHLGAGTALAVLASGRLGVSVGQAGIVDDDGFTVGFPDALSVPAVALFAVSTVLLLVALLRLVPAIRTLAP